MNDDLSRREFLRAAGAGAAAIALAAIGCGKGGPAASTRPAAGGNSDPASKSGAAAGGAQATSQPASQPASRPAPFAPGIVSDEVRGKWPFDGRRADWLYRGKWGVMFHYVYSIRLEQPTHERWDRQVKAFDAAGLADQLASVGAGHMILSLAQGPAPNAPNSIYDRNATNLPQPRSMTRDLIADVAAALGRKGIGLIVYAPGGAPGVIAPEGKFFPDWWPDALREYSRRWGPAVRGWWFDGFSRPEERNRLLAEAVRAGNAAALCAFNRPHGPIRNSAYEDYTSGDIHVPNVTCGGRFVDDAQWHMLSFLGFLWGHCLKKVDVPRFGDDYVAERTASLVKPGGVVTWDVPAQANGLIHPRFLQQLAAAGAAVKDVKRA